MEDPCGRGDVGDLKSEEAEHAEVKRSLPGRQADSKEPSWQVVRV